jgi:amino acid transporter
MGVVVVAFLASVARLVISRGGGAHAGVDFARPFYDPATFDVRAVAAGTSLAVLTYIGFDGVSTLSEEVRDPRRNIPLATVLVCAVTGVLSAVEVYAAQLAWGSSRPFPRESVDAAFPLVGQVAGGRGMFHALNATVLVANFGSAMAAQFAASRLLYGMGRGGAIPGAFFGAVDPRSKVPRNNVLAVGGVSLVGALALEYLGRSLGETAYQLGAQVLNFGAFVAFMGVNAAAFARALARGERTLGALAPPALGFLVCGVIGVALSTAAKVIGLAWVALGAVYGAAWMRKRGGARALSFEAPPE